MVHYCYDLSKFAATFSRFRKKYGFFFIFMDNLERHDKNGGITGRLYSTQHTRVHLCLSFKSCSFIYMMEFFLPCCFIKNFWRCSISAAGGFQPATARQRVFLCQCLLQHVFKVTGSVVWWWWWFPTYILPLLLLYTRLLWRCQAL